jgi:hypothetical protein
MAGVLQRLLTRSGILPVLRRQWRDDQAVSNAKLVKQLDSELASLKAQVDRIAAVAEQLQHSKDKALLERFDRMNGLVRVMHSAMVLDIEHQLSGRDPRSAFDVPRVGAHVARAIAGARIETDSSVHVIINDLMPADTYQAILDGIPPRVFFNQRDDAKQNMKLDQVDIVPQWTLQTLTFIENELIPRMMVPALLQRLAPHIRDFYVREYGPEKGPPLAALPHFASGNRLMLRRPGYHLDPHLDPRRAVFTALIYLARPGDSEAYGTSFYRMNGTPQIDRSNTFYPRTQGIQCDLVKMVPFKANSAVAFLNWGGAHGADIPKDAPADTLRYSYQFYVSPDPAGVASIVGETEAAVME